MTFIDYLDKFIEMKDKWGTKKVYVETRKKIEMFDPDATFQTINLEWLSKFESWMKESGCGVNYTGKQLRNIRAVFNYAIDNEVTTLYPFRRFSKKRGDRETFLVRGRFTGVKRLRRAGVPKKV